MNRIHSEHPQSEMVSCCGLSIEQCGALLSLWAFWDMLMGVEVGVYLYDCRKEICVGCRHFVENYVVEVK